MWLKRLAWLALLLVVAGAAAAGLGWRWAQAELARPLFDSDEAAVLDVSAGASLRALAGQLERRGWLRHPEIWVWYGRYTGQASAIKAGEYELAPGTSAVELLDQLVAGKALLHSVTLVEGWSFRQIRAALDTAPALAHDSEALDDAEVMSRIGRPDEHPEGWFFPDTYRFGRGTSDLQILRQAHARMHAELDRVWQQRVDDLPLASAYEALILASIIEKETALDTERATIAGVFTRRLLKNMRLQTDPTVIYGLGVDFDGDLRRRDLRSDTPYNTYTRSGLPPTPIAMPGAASLQAAVAPAAGDSLYFVATGESDGSHYFSATLAEHNEAVARYLKRLRQRP